MNNLLLKAEFQQILHEFDTPEEVSIVKKVHGKNFAYEQEASLIANLDFGKTIITEEDGDGYGENSHINYFFDSNNNRISKIEMGYDVIYSKPYIISLYNSTYCDMRIRVKPDDNAKTTVYDIRNLRKIYENGNSIKTIMFND